MKSKLFIAGILLTFPLSMIAMEVGMLTLQGKLNFTGTQKPILNCHTENAHCEMELDNSFKITYPQGGKSFVTFSANVEDKSYGCRYEITLSDKHEVILKLNNNAPKTPTKCDEEIEVMEEPFSVNLMPTQPN